MQQIRLKCLASYVTMEYFEVHEVKSFLYKYTSMHIKFLLKNMLKQALSCEWNAVVNYTIWTLGGTLHCWVLPNGSRATTKRQHVFTLVCVTQHNCSKIYYHYYSTLYRPYLSCFSADFFYFSFTPNPQLNQHWPFKLGFGPSVSKLQSFSAVLVVQLLYFLGWLLL